MKEFLPSNPQALEMRVKQNPDLMKDYKKKVFEGRSLIFRIQYYFWTAGCAILFIYLCTRIFDNWTVISIINFFLLLVIFGGTTDKIVVYEDGFLITSQSLIKLFSSKDEFVYNEVARIDASLPLDASTGIIVSIVSFLSPVGNRTSNSFSVGYKDGTVKDVQCKVFRSKIEKAFAYIKQYSNLEIKVSED